MRAGAEMYGIRSVERPDGPTKDLRWSIPFSPIGVRSGSGDMVVATEIEGFGRKVSRTST